MLPHAVPTIPASDLIPDRGDLLNVEINGLYRAMQRIGSIKPYARDQEIYGEGDRPSRLFLVIDGAVRICKYRDAGQRQIEAFQLPGDLFGFDAERECRFTAEATTDSLVLVANVDAVMGNATCERVMNALWKASVQALLRCQDHVLLLGCRNAQERILAFLHEMAERSNRSAAIDLPMSRQDIADYLGLTIETVSRAFADMARRAEIDLPRPRHVILKNMRSLQRSRSPTNAMTL